MTGRTALRLVLSALLFSLLLPLAVAIADKPDTKPPLADEPGATEKKAKDKFKPLPAPKGLVKLTKDYDVWIDLKKDLVVVDGRVCLREGRLEMFACPKGTGKEHESIVAVNSKASFVHAGLMAIGAKVGRPVSFDPKYVPASGMEVEVKVFWIDEKGKKHTVRAQEMILNVKTDKAMKYNWVFAGSGFWTDERTGKRHYHADAGFFICVSNFSVAMLDLPVKSSAANAGLLFKANTKKIPPKGTHVRLILKPIVKVEKDKKPIKKKAGAKKSAKKKVELKN